MVCGDSLCDVVWRDEFGNRVGVLLFRKSCGDVECDFDEILGGDSCVYLWCDVRSLGDVMNFNEMTCSEVLPFTVTSQMLWKLMRRLVC